ncbi:MAG: glycogen/starch/alpha-glucan phosphorylase [Christensenellales bacterium]|jgi:starch phosphorylase
MGKVQQDRIIETIQHKLLTTYGITREQASKRQLYIAVAKTLREGIMSQWAQSNMQINQQGLKKLYYLSVEFLMGRALYNNMVNMLQDEDYRQALERIGVSLDELREEEQDPGLGNGGLGRLAACFLDSLASLELPAVGCGIRYEYGLFKQTVVDGEQTESPDVWLEDGAYVWDVERTEESMPVLFGGTMREEWGEDGKLYIHREGYHTVMAVPYDVPIVGYDTPTVNTLRLWSARSPKQIDMEFFSKGQYIRAMEERELAEVISKMLYPADDHYEGKSLRLKQHYFFSSATMQYIVKEHKKNYHDLNTLPDKVAVQINDTHPALAMPELMRILMDEEGFGWDDAFDITRRVFAYTNHTVMSEALETWPVPLLRDLLPRVFSIIKSLHHKYLDKLNAIYPGQWERISHMAVIGNAEDHNGVEQVRMANLCVLMGHAVNGVSQLHTDILKRGIFRESYVLEPHKFHGITNGITHRRWLIESNRALYKLINEAIGTAWIKEPQRLQELLKYKDDAAFLQQIEIIKQQNKQRLAKFLYDHQGAVVDPSTLFDVQAKRLHEYKRQLLNILHVIYLYNCIKENPKLDFPPQTFIFGAKAWPGYIRAKMIIKLITSVGAMLDQDPDVKGRLKVVFLENYGVSSAEILIPGADISEQLSVAGKEASGTGNMKFMMNGAITIGTMDGANVEIHDEVGRDNIFIFGLSAQEAEYKLNHHYRAGDIYTSDMTIKAVLDRLIDGSLVHTFDDLFSSLVISNDADQYLVLADFDSYRDVHADIVNAYEDRARWNGMALVNIAKSGYFSSDRTIGEYNRKIWHLSKIQWR